MKKIFLIPGLILTMAACNSGNKDSNALKKAKLDDLRKQEVELKDKITKLEAELKTNDSTQAPVPVSELALQPEIFKNYIDIQGRVDADENVSLSTEMPGTITKINVKTGDEVAAGQVLAETDARAIYQNIADLQANADLVNQIFEKQKNLWNQKIGTEVQYLQAKTNKESMEKKMAALQQQLAMSKITSPISGTVDAIDVKVGQLAAPGMPAIRVINYSNLKVKADISESYASKIKKGAEVIVRFPDADDTLLTNVNFVSRAINANTRSFTAEVLLDNNKQYHPNMVAKLSINDYASAQKVITVPVKVIQKDEKNASFVFVDNNGVTKKQIVTVGKEYNGKAEIVSGLKAGDLLITQGYDAINEGDKITDASKVK